MESLWRCQTGILFYCCYSRVHRQLNLAFEILLYARISILECARSTRSGSSSSRRKADQQKVFHRQRQLYYSAIRALIPICRVRRPERTVSDNCFYCKVEGACAFSAITIISHQVPDSWKAGIE